MVVNSDSGEVTSLHAYFNKYLVSVEQLNSILGRVGHRHRLVSLLGLVLFLVFIVFQLL